MEARLFNYTVQFLPEDEELYANKMDGGRVTENGLIAATTYGEAVENIVHYYGEENIIEVSIYECENPLCQEEIEDFLK